MGEERSHGFSALEGGWGGAVILSQIFQSEVPRKFKSRIDRIGIVTAHKIYGAFYFNQFPSQSI